MNLRPFRSGRAALGAAVLAIASLPLAAGGVTSGAAASSPGRDVRRTADCADFPPATKAFFNDPRITIESSGRAGNDVQDVIECYVQGTPSSGKIRVATWNLTDDTIGQVLEAADRRGVTVRVIMAAKNCSAGAAVDLRAELNDHSNGSRLTCIHNSSRGPKGSGTMHQKSFTFSQVGGSRHVTLVGSANMTVEGYEDQFVDMFSYADRRDVYKFYNDVFAIQEQDENQATKFYAQDFNGGTGRAELFPVDDETPDQGDDPVLTRIQGIPGGSGTTVWVANYAIKDARGTWLKDALVALAQSGAKVRVISGPSSSTAIEDALAAGGVNVRRGFHHACSDHTTPDTKSCNYIHLKLMAAKYQDAAGEWHHQVWTGSDNWSSASLVNDEAIQLIGGQTTYDQYAGFLRSIWRAYRNEGV